MSRLLSLEVYDFGQAQLEGREKSKLLRALYNGMAGNGFRAACFSPRHGIRVVQNGKTVDLVICFHCRTFVTYAEEKKGKSMVSKDTQKYFDSVLTSAGVPLSPH